MGAGLLKYQLELLFLLQRTRELKEFGITAGTFDERVEAARRIDQQSAEAMRRALERVNQEALTHIADHAALVGLMEVLVMVRDHAQLFERLGCTVDQEHLTRVHTLVVRFDREHNRYSQSADAAALSTMLAAAESLVAALPLMDWQILLTFAKSLPSEGEGSRYVLEFRHLRKRNLDELVAAQRELVRERDSQRALMRTQSLV